VTALSPAPARALDGIDRTFDAQRAAFRRAPNPPAAERVRHLDAVCRLLVDNGDAIAAAIRADFGHRSPYETRLLDLFPSLQEAKYARARVAKWMRAERRPSSLWFQPGRSRVVKQPLGVVGIIAPWNYPINLSVGPLVAALAAGNRVMIKMSEFTPKTGALLAQLLAKHFAEDHVAVVNGGVDAGQAFSAKPFDHLLFTGSTSVGREVMRAAAANLTPVTLELGGKSPAIISPDFPLNVAARRIMLGKCMNAGQTCIAPDYVLLAASAMQPFVEAARAVAREFYPQGAASNDFCAIVNDRHHARLLGLLDDARMHGATIETLAGGDVPAHRKLAPSIITGVKDEMRIMQDEIFGPLLPLVPYETLDDAFAYVANHPRPLAMYYFDYDSARTARMLRDTIAGGVTVNDTIFHFAQEELPFGGVGASGMGSYHGEDGFSTFSRRKGVFFQSRINGGSLLAPPFGRTLERLLRLMVR
jgi:acyl-CoA reductase-like NAD-dependent aldehyde dehydrogenase